MAVCMEKQIVVSNPRQEINCKGILLTEEELVGINRQIERRRLAVNKESVWRYFSEVIQKGMSVR